MNQGNMNMGMELVVKVCQGLIAAQLNHALVKLGILPGVGIHVGGLLELAN